MIKSVGIVALLTSTILFLSGCAILQTLDDSNHPIASVTEQNRSPANELEMQRILIQQAMHERDLVIGMTMTEVQQTWGEPREVEIAGDARHGNQKWLYPIGLSSRWSASATRVVYFESGQVAGWDTVH